MIFTHYMYQFSINNITFLGNDKTLVFKNRCDFIVFSIIVGKRSKLLNFLIHRARGRWSRGLLQSLNVVVIVSFIIVSLVFISFLYETYDGWHTTSFLARYSKSWLSRTCSACEAMSSLFDLDLIRNIFNSRCSRLSNLTRNILYRECVEEKKTQRLICIEWRSISSK